MITVWLTWIVAASRTVSARAAERPNMRVAFTILLLVQLIFACPDSISHLCVCEDLHNGVRLDCSNSDGVSVLQLLKENQASLGLVQQLVMQKTNLRKLPANFISGIYVKTLDLSNNQIAYIDDEAFKDPNSIIHELILNHNNLTKIPVAALSALPSLLRLDLSNNSIADLKESDTFPGLNKLFDINLGSNKICNVHSSVFQKIKNSIQTINFGRNCLKATPASAIRGMTQLQSIHLHYNDIMFLDSLSFLNLPVLNLLNLANNNITGISRQAFLNVPNLRYFYLTSNNISKIEPHQFTTFERMEMLDLTDNNIRTLNAGSLSNMVGLRQLYLGNNKIHKIERGVFSKSSTTILVLSGNQLEIIDEGVFEEMPSLQQLSLKSNKLKIIHANAFYNISSVVMLDLSNNLITTLSPSTFLAQANLLLIDLSRNKMKQTPYSAFNQRIGTVLLQENPLVCTEKVHMIQDGVGVYVPNSEDIVCGGHPKTTTTKPAVTTRAPRLIQIPMMPHRQHSTADSTRAAGAFQQLDQIEQRELLPSRSQEEEQDEELGDEMKEVKGKNTQTRRVEEESTEDEIESGSPKKTPHLITRNRSIFGSNINSNPAIETDVEPSPEENPEPELNPVEMATTERPPRRYTDLADNPHAIHPFPVPFLKRGPIMHQAKKITFNSTSTAMTSQEIDVQVHTLPPSIVIAPHRTVAQKDDNHVEQFALHLDKELKPSAKEEEKPALAISSAIILICIGLVAIVMIVVCGVLCFVRHRKATGLNYSYSEDSSTPAHPYGHMHPDGMQGTLRYHRTMVPPQDSHPWVYNPGPNYSNYYGK